jgi:hypothetical protein
MAAEVAVAAEWVEVMAAVAWAEVTAAEWAEGTAEWAEGTVVPVISVAVTWLVDTADMVMVDIEVTDVAAVDGMVTVARTTTTIPMTMTITATAIGGTAGASADID